MFVCLRVAGCAGICALRCVRSGVRACGPPGGHGRVRAGPRAVMGVRVRALGRTGAYARLGACVLGRVRAGPMGELRLKL